MSTRGSRPILLARMRSMTGRNHLAARLSSHRVQKGHRRPQVVGQRADLAGLQAYQGPLLIFSSCSPGDDHALSWLTRVALHFRARSAPSSKGGSTVAVRPQTRPTRHRRPPADPPACCSTLSDRSLTYQPLAETIVRTPAQRSALALPSSRTVGSPRPRKGRIAPPLHALLAVANPSVKRGTPGQVVKVRERLGSG
jgi:hypothetical protein